MVIEDKVVELLQLANYSVKSTPLGPKYSGCSVEAIRSTSTGITSQTITCLDDPHQLAPVLKFSTLPKGSWVVLPDERPPSMPPGLLRIVEKRKLKVLTLTLFYDEMLRAKEICTQTAASKVRWKDEVITLDRLAELYVPQRAKAINNSHEERVDDSNVMVTSLLTRRGGAVIFILADAGRGKTWLTWSFGQDAARKYLEATANVQVPKDQLPPIPFLIPFSQYKRLTSFDGIVLERLNSFGTLDIRAEGFKHLLARGRIVLILDGFDEMLELAPAHARENLREIRRHLQGQSKLVLTSRRSIFPTKKEIFDFIQLSGPETDSIDLTVCYLEGFSPDQLKGFHRARGADNDEINKILNLPFDRQLHESPQIAEYFLDIVRADLPLKQENVFPTILSLIYKRESDKWAREASQPMPADLQERFLTEVSLLMWPEGSASPDLMQLFADELGHRYLSKHHLLQPTLDGQLQFEHHVWRDWFMARALLERISKSNWAPRALSDHLANPLPEYCIGFLATQVDQDKMRVALNEPSVSGSAFSNVLRILLSQLKGGKDATARAKALAGALSSSEAFKYRRLQKVRLEMFDFRDWAFEGTTFDDVVFSFCTLPRVFHKVLKHGRGLSIVDCTWFPEEALPEEAIREAQESLRQVLRRFIISADPVKVRDEVSKEQMVRDFRIAEDDPALRCLMKLGYIRIGLQAKSEEFYLVDKRRLEELVSFVRTNQGLQNVISCIAR